MIRIKTKLNWNIFVCAFIKFLLRTLHGLLRFSFYHLVWHMFCRSSFEVFAVSADTCFQKSPLKLVLNQMLCSCFILVFISFDIFQAFWHGNYHIICYKTPSAILTPQSLLSVIYISRNRYFGFMVLSRGYFVTYCYAYSLALLRLTQSFQDLQCQA